MKKKKVKFPDDKILGPMRIKLEKHEGAFVLPPDAGVVDRAKYDVCRQLLIYMHKKGIKQKELAAILKVPETRISEIVHYKISKFTLDKLISYYEVINPTFVLKVA